MFPRETPRRPGEHNSGHLRSPLTDCSSYSCVLVTIKTVADRSQIQRYSTKKAGTLPTLQSLWTGPTPIDIPAYMRDAKNGIETYQTGIVHLV